MGTHALLRRFPPIARRERAIATVTAERDRLRRSRRKLTRQLQDEKDARSADRTELEARLNDAESRLKDAQRRLKDAEGRLTDAKARLADAEGRCAAAATTLAAQEAAAQKALVAQERRLLRPADKPSFHVKLHEAARVRAIGVKRDLWLSPPVMDVNDKDAGYAFARSHGIAAPRQLASFERPDLIDWSELPDNFVIKTLRGTSSRGVLVLERVTGGYIDHMAGDHAVMSQADVIGYLDARVLTDQVSPELVIEEALPSPYGDGRKIVPDAKLYCFYGTVGMVMMAARSSRRAADVSFRYFDAAGTDLGDARTGSRHDPSIPGPMHVPALVAAGSLLSAALPEPFVRLDFYEQSDGIVFGETTLGPGGKQLLRSDVDQLLGAMWEDAEARLRAEAYTAQLRGPRFGDLATWQESPGRADDTSVLK